MFLSIWFLFNNNFYTRLLELFSLEMVMRSIIPPPFNPYFVSLSYWVHRFSTHIVSPHHVCYCFRRGGAFFFPNIFGCTPWQCSLLMILPSRIFLDPPEFCLLTWDSATIFIFLDQRLIFSIQFCSFLLVLRQHSTTFYWTYHFEFLFYHWFSSVTFSSALHLTKLLNFHYLPLNQYVIGANSTNFCILCQIFSYGTII